MTSAHEHHLTDWQWFKIRLRVEALERRTSAFGYRFEFQPPSGKNTEEASTIIKCYVFFDPKEIQLESPSPLDRTQIFLEWRSAAIHVIEDALVDTPELAAKMSIERQLRFFVLEGYGMGSKKIFEMSEDGVSGGPDLIR